MDKEKIKSDIHETALERFDVAMDYYEQEYRRGKDDMEFALGDQWEEEIRAERLDEGRPCLTENRMIPFINQVVNSIRQSRPTINVKPVDGQADVKVAEVLQGLIKNIEVVSDAETAYDTAAFNAVSTGYGFIRVDTDYSDYDSFEQDINISRVLDPHSVLIDPMCTRLDAADAEYAFIYEDVSKEEYKKRYPEADTDSFEKGMTGNWNLGKDTVRIAEYFYKEYKKEKLVKYSIPTLSGVATGVVVGMDNVPEGADIVEERDTEVCKIKHCVLNGAEVLSEGEWAGKFIPLVPVIGFEAFKDGRREVYSLIHQAKDPQRMFNYWKTASTEIFALQSKSPYIAAEGQLTGYEKQWANSNRKNYPYLYYKITRDKATGQLAPPPQRQAPPTGSQTMMQEVMMAADGIKSSLGMYDAAVGNQSPDVSGKAIISRQMQGENANYHFIDNLQTAMKHVGRILVDLIPRIYSEPRIIRTLGEDGTEAMMPVNQPSVKASGGKYRLPMRNEESDTYLDLKLGKYDVVVEIGASYATRRQEFVNYMIEVARVRPEIFEVAGDLFVASMDMPNAQKIADRIRAQMPPELLGDDVEAQRLKQLTSQLQQMQQALEQTELALQVKRKDEAFKNNLELQKVQNDTKKLEIEAMKTMAEINKINMEVEKEIPAEAMKDIAEAISTLKGQFDDVSGAVRVILSEKEGEATGMPEMPV